MTHPRLNVVSMSGGKDSTATRLLAIERCDPLYVASVFADTGNEHEATYEYLAYLEEKLGISIVRLKVDFTDRLKQRREYVMTKWPDKGVPQAVCERAVAALVPSGNPFLDLCLWKGLFPSRRAQFCTQFLKTEPLVEYQMSLVEQGYEVWSWQGVRADESPNRAKLAELEELGDGIWNHRPIHKWTIDDVFAMHRKHGVEPNPLYSQGMKRVGCMPCINSSKGEVLEIAKRFPHHIDRIERWEDAVKQASKRGDASFFADPTEDAHLNRRGIRNIVQWSKTSRGGRQFNFFAGDEPKACSSAYGLCE